MKHKADRHCQCPHCGSTLADRPIPVESLGMYGGHDGEPMDCAHGCGRPAHYSRLVGIYSMELDRTVEWMCPDCQTRWPR